MRVPTKSSLGLIAISITFWACRSIKEEVFEVLNICQVGQILAPGESCNVPGNGTFSVREDGCVGEGPYQQGDPVRTNLSISTMKGTCMESFLETSGFRASEVPGSSKTDLMDFFSQTTSLRYFRDEAYRNSVDNAIEETKELNKSLPDFPSWQVDAMPSEP